MSNCSWDKISSFQSPSEFTRFVQWIEAQASSRICEELRKNVPDLNDRRFKCKATGEVWKLSYPDLGYFSGSWLPDNN